MRTPDLSVRRRRPLTHTIARWGLAGFLALGTAAFAVEDDPQDPAYRKLVTESFEGISPLEVNVYEAVEKLPAAKRKAVAEAFRKSGYLYAASNAYTLAAAAYPDDKALQVEAELAQGDASLQAVRDAELEGGMPPNVMYECQEEAALSYRRALALAPDRLDLVRRVVEVTLMIGEASAETVTYADRLAAAKPDDLDLMVLKATATLDALQNGLEDMDQAHLKSAKALIERIVKTAPKEPRGHTLHCRLYQSFFEGTDGATIDAVVNAALTQCPDTYEVVRQAGYLGIGSDRRELMQGWSQKLLGSWSENLTAVQQMAMDWQVQLLYKDMSEPQGGDQAKPMVSPEFGKSRHVPIPKVAAATLLGEGFTMPKTLDDPGFEEARSTIDKAIMADPDFAKAWYCRAQLDFLDRDMTRGVYEITQALRLDPKNADYYRLRGDFFINSSSRAQFLADYRSALKLMPATAEDRPKMLEGMARAVTFLRNPGVAGAYAEEVAAAAATESTDSSIPLAQMLVGMDRNDACAVFAGWYAYAAGFPGGKVSPRSLHLKIYEEWLAAHKPKLQLFELVRWLIADPTNAEVQALVFEKGGIAPKGFKYDAFLNFQKARLTKQDPAALELLAKNGPDELAPAYWQLSERIAAEAIARKQGTRVVNPVKAAEFDAFLVPSQLMSSTFESRASWYASQGQYAEACRDAAIARVLDQLDASDERDAQLAGYIEVLEHARDGALTPGDTSFLKATYGLGLRDLTMAPDLSIFDAWYSLSMGFPEHAGTKAALQALTDVYPDLLDDAIHSYLYDAPTQDQMRLKAVADYLLALNEKDVNGLYARGYEYYKAGRSADAMKAVEAAIAITRSNPGANLLRGRMYLAQNRFKEALTDLAIATEGDFSLPVLAGDLAAVRKAEASLGGVVEILTFYLNTSSDFYKATEYRAAASLQVRGLSFATESRGKIKYNNGEGVFQADCYYFTMLCYSKINENKLVVKNADLMLKANPNHASAATAYNNWLNALNNMGDREEEERVARLGLKAFPQDASLWVHLGYSMAYRKRAKEAREALDKALRFASYEPDYYYFYATAMEAADQDAVAIEMLTKALEKAPADWSRRTYSTNMLNRLNKAEVTQLASGDFGSRSKVTLPPKIKAAQGLNCDVVMLGWDHKEASVFEAIVPSNLLNVATYDRIDQRDDHLNLIMMGKEVKVEARLGRTYKSDSGKQIAFELRYPDNTVRFAVNGVLSQPYRSLNGFSFADDDSTWFAAVKTLESPYKITMVLNGSAIGTWDSVTHMRLAEGDQYALLVKDGGKMQLIVNGEATPVDSSATSLEMTDDGKHYAYVVKTNDSYSYVYDGTAFGPYDSIASTNNSKDGQHLWALAVNPPGDNAGRITYTMIVNGVPQPVDPAVIDGDRAPKIWVSDNASGWAIYVKKLFSGIVCHNGVLAGKFKNVSDMVFSDDGTHIAFQAEVGGEKQIVVDSTDSYALWPGYTAPADKPDQKPELKRLIMSPDGKRVAWSAQAGTTVGVVERDTLRFSGDRLPFYSINFSADSRRLALLDLVDNGFVLRIEDEAWRIPYNNIFTALVPSGEGGVRFIAFNVLPDGRRVFQRVEVPLN